MGIIHRFISPIIFILSYYFYKLLSSRKLISWYRERTFQIFIYSLFFFNLGFPLLRGFFSEAIIVSFIGRERNFISLILILSFFVPILFTLNILVIFCKLNERSFRVQILSLSNFFTLLMSLFLIYSFLYY